MKGIEADDLERRQVEHLLLVSLTSSVQTPSCSWFQTSSIWYLGKDRPITNIRETPGVSNQRRHRSRLKTRRIRPQIKSPKACIIRLGSRNRTRNDSIHPHALSVTALHVLFPSTMLPLYFASGSSLIHTSQKSSHASTDMISDQDQLAR